MTLFDLVMAMALAICAFTVGYGIGEQTGAVVTTCVPTWPI